MTSQAMPGTTPSTACDEGMDEIHVSNMNNRNELRHLVRQLRESLALDAAFGVHDVLLSRPAATRPPAAASPPTQGAPPPVHRQTRPAAEPAQAPPQPAPLSPDAQHKAEALAAIQARAAQCQRCALGATRTNLVFGVGNPDARLMFIGEAPGEDEDLQGEPFVGKAGQLLTRIITNGMKLQRSDVYIANILKCRPPGNRTPSPTEMALCREYLIEQIDIIQPTIIVALGAVAVAGLTGTTVAISKIRGQFFQWRHIQVMPTYHPAYLLRNPSAKRLVWDDIRKVIKALGIGGLS